MASKKQQSSLPDASFDVKKALGGFVIRPPVKDEKLTIPTTVRRAKSRDIFQVDDPIAHTMKTFKAMQKNARKERQAERRDFYRRISQYLEEKVINGAFITSLGEDKGFALVARVDIGTPGKIRVVIYVAKDGLDKRRTQNQICKDRSLWFGFVKSDEDRLAGARVLTLIKHGLAEYREDKALHFQTINLESDIIPDQKELDRLFDPEPMKILA
jgi:hypothetical protein